jgi:hypothetical protein
MNLKKILIWSLVCILFGCEQEELVNSEGMSDVKMKTVTVSAGIDGTETRASLDSQTGAFTWQSGDLISVLATDGKFYDFILEGEAGKKTAEFVGSIPEESEITTVATYPRIVANGTTNTVLNGNTLNYVLPATWDYAQDVSNVPMVATFGEAADVMAFKQVGGVMRFPVKNMPTKATFVVTMKNKAITGQFPVDITTLGKSYMTTTESASELVINYSSDVDGKNVEFNVPVPVGIYNDFQVTIKDAEGNELVTKEYSKENTVSRATLLIMKELVLPERPMVVSEVWPFFVDARVVFGKHEGVEQYAFYVDGSEEPVIKDVEDLGDKLGALVGGTFEHNTAHTVAVAKVINGAPVVESKSEAVEFTTANVYQLTTNTGTQFVSVGWDDVAIPNGTKYVNGEWTAIPKVADKNGLKGHQRRGYKVRLTDAAGNVVYEMIPFTGHEAFTAAYSNSTWLGSIDGAGIAIPTALSFGWLEPSQNYYFQVKALDETIMFDASNGNYAPEGYADQPYPYALCSERGGCEWSKPVKLVTNSAHVPTANEILFEGFEDMFFTNDLMNWATAVVPDMETTKRQSWDNYLLDIAEGYNNFLKLPVNERKWTTMAFSKLVNTQHYGLHDSKWSDGTIIPFNDNAGCLKGWSYSSNNEKRGIYPIFGAVRIGQSSGGTSGSPALYTPALQSEKLMDNIATKCKVSAKVSYSATSKTLPVTTLTISRYSNGIQIGESINLSVKDFYPSEYAAIIGNRTEENYVSRQQYYELSCEIFLKKGDVLSFQRGNGKAYGYGLLIVDDIKVEVIPGVYEEPFADNGLGTEPDDTNYDIFGLNEFPITYYWGPPTRVYTQTDPTTGTSYYDYELTKQAYNDVKDAGFNIVTYTGECDFSMAENKRLLGICEELGLKFISSQGGGHQGGYSVDNIPTIKENLYSSPAYVGEFLRDEPVATEFDDMGAYVKEYLRQMPDKEVYTNLFPYYANSVQLGTSTYEAHINQYLSKVPSKMLGFDHYGLEQQSTWLRKSYHKNYDLVRAKTLARRMPYLVITAAGGVGTGIKEPTEKELRWEVWSSIALGSKGISYFTYWTPLGDAGLATNEYMISRDGEKRDMYYWVKQVNADINTIGKKLINCHADGAITSVTNIYPLYTNDGKGRTNYGPIKSVIGTVDHLCGCFRDARTSQNGANYKGYKALVTHLLPARGDFSINLTIDASVSEITFTHNNTIKTLSLQNLLNEYIDTNVLVSYLDGVLTLSMPEGEAVLLEF